MTTEPEPTAAPQPAPPALTLMSRSEILDARDAIYHIEPVPEWKAGGAIRLRSLSFANRIELERRIAANKAHKNEKGAADPLPELHGIGEWILIESCVDEAGRPILTAEDAAALSQRSATVIQRVIGIVIKMADADVQAAAKN